MTELKTIDELLSNEVLFYTGEEKDFRMFLSSNEHSYALNRLYNPELGIKFMLFQKVDYECYLRLQMPDHESSHQEIISRFRKEVKAADMGKLIFNEYGGGYIKANRENGKTKLLFYGLSDSYGRFNEKLLKSLLDSYLDKRINYEISSALD